MHMPFAAVILIFVVCAALCRPFGNFPLNDDWQYAHVAKQFVETGKIIVDVPIAPTLVGQSLVAYPFIRLFGFSHVLLRVLTFALAIGCLWFCDRLLVLARVERNTRSWALLAIALNPFFFHLSMSFMTEVYGFFWALLAAWIWFEGVTRESKRAGDAFDGFPAPTIALICAVLSAFAFWSRQFAGLLFPALWASSFWGHWRWKRGLVSGLMFVVLSLSYFFWAKATGNYKPQFALPLGTLLKPRVDLYLKHIPFWVAYLTCFCLGLLWVWKRDGRENRCAAAAWCAWAFTIGAYAWAKFDHSLQLSEFRRPYFPFYGNIWSQYSMGPITTTDVYILNEPARPAYSPWAWVVIEAFLFAMALRWGKVFRSFGVSEWRESVPRQMAAFGFWSVIGTLAVVVGAFQWQIFDRYLLGAALGAILSVAVLYEWSGQSFSRLAYAPVAVIALYTIAGNHDFFRWQEARQQLIQRAQQSGYALHELDAGYEPNGWEYYQSRKSLGEDDACLGLNWFCTNRPYRITFNARPTDEVIETVFVPSWLGRYPPLSLVKLDRTQP